MKLGLALANFSWPVPVSELGATIINLARQADDAGREYAEIEKTTATRLDLADGTTINGEALLARLHELSALGFGHVLLSPNGPWTPAAVDAVVSLLPEIHALAG